MRKSYSIRDGFRVYAIGDIHGYAQAHDRMLAAIQNDIKTHPGTENHIVYLGDYIDRGPDSAGVIDRLIEAGKQGDGIKRTFLRGNHEHLAQEFLRTGAPQYKWFHEGNGGQTTLASYGLKAPQQPVDETTTFPDLRDAFEAALQARGHIEFLNSLPDMHVIDGYLFVHAGVRPGIPLKKQTSKDLLTIRRDFLESEDDFGKRVVHGHSITLNNVPAVKPNRIAVDTGVYNNKVLSCAVLEGTGARFLQVSSKP